MDPQGFFLLSILVPNFSGFGISGGGTQTVTWPNVSQSFTNPATSSDVTDVYLTQITDTVDWSLNSIGFTDTSMLEWVFVVWNGLYQYDQGAKTTFSLSKPVMTCYGAGQRFLENYLVNSYGMGDQFASAIQIYFGGGVDCDGDEGQGVWDVTCEQQTILMKTTIQSVSTNTVNTTTTQAITKSQIPQTVTVGNTTGLSVGKWITIDPQHPGGDAEAIMECVYVSALTATSITGIFTRNHNIGVAVLPTTVLVLSSFSRHGQHRWLVNLTQPSYTIGTASIPSGSNTATGIGTSWSNTMVGGDSTGYNVGMITFAADNNTFAPFNAGNGPLRDWYPITTVGSVTSLSILHRSQAGTPGYSGLATSTGSYQISPGCRIQALGGSTPTGPGASTVVLPYNTFAWTAGDSVETALSPDLDMTGMLLRMGAFSTGGTYRAIFDARNCGYQTITAAYKCEGIPGFGAQASNAFTYGAYFSNCATGVYINDTTVVGLFINASANAQMIGFVNAQPGVYWNQSNQALEYNFGPHAHAIGTNVEQGVLSFVPNGGTPPTTLAGFIGQWYMGGALTLLPGTDGVSTSLTIQDSVDIWKILAASLSHSALQINYAPVSSPTSITSLYARLDNMATVTATYTIAHLDSYIRCSNAGASYNITLPAASSVYPGKPYDIKKTDNNTNPIAIVPNGTDTIDGAASYILNTAFQFVRIRSNGSNGWDIVGAGS